MNPELVSLLENLGVGLALLYVILAMFHRKQCWYACIVSSVLYIPVFASAKLYMDASLQLFFIGGGVYGLLQWTKTEVGVAACNVVRLWPVYRHCTVIVIGSIIAACFSVILQRYTDAAFPFVDSMIMVFSIITTFLTGQKLLENWIYWCVIDIVGVLVFQAKGLNSTALLYGLYTLLSLIGYIRWYKDYKRELAYV